MYFSNYLNQMNIYIIFINTKKDQLMDDQIMQIMDEKIYF